MFDRGTTRFTLRGAAAPLYDWAVSRSRDPTLYAIMGAPDTVEGRFELLTLHIILLVDRLARAGPDAAESRQALFDLYISNLDGAMREMGVGDLAMGKRMKALGQAFYGRAEAYEEAFSVWPNTDALRQLIARTILPHGDAGPLSAYVTERRDELAGYDDHALLGGLIAQASRA